MIALDYAEFMNIDGRELLPENHEDWIPKGYIECTVCDGDGAAPRLIDEETCICEECAGEGYCPDIDLAGWCVADGCEIATVNKSHGEFLCTEHDPTRKQETKNQPAMYRRKLI